jgi:hypothetical protein
MKVKLKICSVCKRECVLWKATPKLCKDCAAKIKIQEETGLNLNVKVRKPIKKVSEKMYDNLAKYRRLRDKHFQEYPVCQFPGCLNKKITLHHAKGRVGAFLTDKHYFKSLCPKHHTFVEENPTEAQRLGLSFKRLNNE